MLHGGKYVVVLAEGLCHAPVQEGLDDFVSFEYPHLECERHDWSVVEFLHIRSIFLTASMPHGSSV